MTQYRRTLASLKRQLVRAPLARGCYGHTTLLILQNSGSDVREELFRPGNDYATADAFPEQDQLLQKTDTLRRASESLKRAQQVSEETGESS